MQGRKIPAGYPGTGDLGHVLRVGMSSSPGLPGEVSPAGARPQGSALPASHPGMQPLRLGLSPSTAVGSQEKSLSSERVPPEWETIHLTWKMGGGGG